jgi:hypothetical protein
LFTFKVGGAEILLSAREARAQNASFRLLKTDEGETIEVLGETLILTQLLNFDRNSKFRAKARYGR